MVNVSGTGFSPGALASIVQCSSDPTQPVIHYLGNDIPVSCSPLALTTIPSLGKNTGKLSDTHTMTTGTVGPPVSGQPTTCTQTTPSTSTITGCTTSTNGNTDAARFPCPPTPTQEAAVDTCVLAIGDAAGDRAIGIVLFGTETVPTSTTATTGGGSTSTTGATTTTTSPNSTATSTQVSASNVTLGPSNSVSDLVTVRGTTAHGSPTGNVSFYVCQTGTAKTLATGPCAATLADHLATVHLTSGANNSSAAPSGPFVPTSAGTWCFSAVYADDTNYTGSADNTSSANLDAKRVRAGGALGIDHRHLHLGGEPHAGANGLGHRLRHGVGQLGRGLSHGHCQLLCVPHQHHRHFDSGPLPCRRHTRGCQCGGDTGRRRFL